MTNQQQADKLSALNNDQRLYFNHITEGAMFSNMAETLSAARKEEVDSAALNYNEVDSTNQGIINGMVEGGDDLFDFPC